MGKLTDNIKREIIEALTGKRGTKAAALIWQFAMKIPVSQGYIYRLTSKARDAGRRRRRDAGKRRIAVSPHVETFMFALTCQQDLSAPHVIDLTAQHFGLSQEFISPTTYNTWLRRSCLSRSDNRRHQLEMRGN